MSIPLRVGIFGAGIVGGGVIDMLQKLNRSGKLEKMGYSIDICKVCVQSIQRERDIIIDARTTIVSDSDEILLDPTINCVVEVIGGVTKAKDIVLEAIARGKFVVTANKALIATHMTEIQAALAANPTAR